MKNHSVNEEKNPSSLDHEFARTAHPASDPASAYFYRGMENTTTINELKIGQRFYSLRDRRGCLVAVQPSDPSRIMTLVGVTDSGAFRVLRNGQVSTWLNCSASIAMANF